MRAAGGNRVLMRCPAVIVDCQKYGLSPWNVGDVGRSPCRCCVSGVDQDEHGFWMLLCHIEMGLYVVRLAG